MCTCSHLVLRVSIYYLTSARVHQLPGSCTQLIRTFVKSAADQVSRPKIHPLPSKRPDESRVMSTLPRASAPSPAATFAASHALYMALRALRNGGSYGVRVRLPHAVVSGALYSNEDFKTVLKKAFTASFEHGRNLAVFAASYKLVLLLLRASKEAAGAVVEATTGGWGTGGLPSPSPAASTGKAASGWHAAVAGAVGAYLVWRKPSAVNQQICLYLLSRVLMAVCRVLSAKGVAPFSLVSYDQVFPAMAVGTWAAVMYLWETNRGAMQVSLARSMDDIYLTPMPMPRSGEGTGGAGGRGREAWWQALLPTPAAAAVMAFGLANGLPMLPA
jgi:peroxisomal membrane protein 4